MKWDRSSGRSELRYEGGVLVEIDEWSTVHIRVRGLWRMEDFVGTMNDLECLAEQLLVEALDDESPLTADMQTFLRGAEVPTRHVCPAPWGGSAISQCYEKDGELWVDNGEYAARVNYCPCCGFSLLEA